MVREMAEAVNRGNPPPFANVETHIYTRGRHPGDTLNTGDPPSTGGLTNHGFIAYGT